MPHRASIFPIRKRKVGVPEKVKWFGVEYKIKSRQRGIDGGGKFRTQNAV